MPNDRFRFITAAAFLVLLAGCGGSSVRTSGNQAVASDETAVDNNANAEVARMMDLYGRAVLGEDVSAEMETALDDFDSKYDSHLKTNFSAVRERNLTKRAVTYDHSAIPFDTDGAVYLGGGNYNALATIISWVAPLVTRGRYHHGAVFDLDKFDPSNMECQCFETAVAKGAGYQTPQTWKYAIENVCVLNPATPPDRRTLNKAQAALAFYCDPENRNMKYGFFKHYADIFAIVTKEDNYYWYCTKVVWRVYDLTGVDLDSNTNAIDWSKSGLYNVVKSYYDKVYFYNRRKAAQKTLAYVENARRNIVLAEEIYFSPYLTKVYEDIAE